MCDLQGVFSVPEKRFKSKDTSLCLTAAAGAGGGGSGLPKRSRDPDFGIKMAIVSGAVAVSSRSPLLPLQASEEVRLLQDAAVDPVLPPKYPGHDGPHITRRPDWQNGREITLEESLTTHSHSYTRKEERQ